MALSLKEYSSKYYGAVGMAWLQKVVANQSSIATNIADAMQEFVNSAVLPDSTGQIIRVARRFALVAVAGELASQYGLTGWQEGEATYAAYKCYRAWLDHFGIEGNKEDRAILAQVRAFLNLMVPVGLIISERPTMSGFKIVPVFIVPMRQVFACIWY